MKRKPRGATLTAFFCPDGKQAAYWEEKEMGVRRRRVCRGDRRF
jgi:hypothetical protein